MIKNCCRGFPDRCEKQNKLIIDHVPLEIRLRIGNFDATRLLAIKVSDIKQLDKLEQ